MRGNQAHASETLAPVFAPASCSRCGETMNLVAQKGEDSFGWVGDDGTDRCTATAYPPELSDPEWWDRLRAGTANGDVVAGRFYSQLSSNLKICWHPWNKPHIVVGGESAGDGPWCCDEPMRWAHSGWVSRPTPVPGRP